MDLDLDMRIELPSLHGVIDDKNRMNNSMNQSNFQILLTKQKLNNIEKTAITYWNKLKIIKIYHQNESQELFYMQQSVAKLSI